MTVHTVHNPAPEYSTLGGVEPARWTAAGVVPAVGGTVCLTSRHWHSQTWWYRGRDVVWFGGCLPDRFTARLLPAATSVRFLADKKCCSPSPWITSGCPRRPRQVSLLSGSEHLRRLLTASGPAPLCVPTCCRAARSEKPRPDARGFAHQTSTMLPFDVVGDSTGYWSISRVGYSSHRSRLTRLSMFCSAKVAWLELPESRSPPVAGMAWHDDFVRSEFDPRI